MNFLYLFWGKVRKGKNRGKRLGFPTANIRLHKIIPEGVYISKIKTQNKIYNSLTFVGSAKTFNENLYQGETYVFDFNQSIHANVIPAKAGIQKKNLLDSHLHGNDKTKRIYPIDNSLYGQWLSVKLIKKIRGNQKFISEKELIKQMESDKKIAEKFFKINV